MHAVRIYDAGGFARIFNLSFAEIGRPVEQCNRKDIGATRIPSYRIANSIRLVQNLISNPDATRITDRLINIL